MLFKTMIDKNQRGFTLIELLVVLAITGLIIGGTTTAIFQVFNTNARISSHMIAITQVQNAGYRISHDALMAQRIIISDNTLTPETEVLTLAWVGWEYESADNTGINTYEVRYTYDSDQLWRRQKITTDKYDSNGHLVETTESQNSVLVAEHITAISFSSMVNKLTGSITASVGEIEEARTYEITPRPSS